MSKKKAKKATPSARTIKRTIKVRGDAALVDLIDAPPAAARRVQLVAREIKASRARSVRSARRIDRVSRQTDAVLARLKSVA